MAKVELKKPVVDEISANLEGAAGVVLVDHCGLTVEQDTQLRKQMREEGIVYKVYKNTMLNFAIKGTEFEPLSQHLEGPSAIAISKTDATAPARIVANFAKKAEKLEIKAGVVEGNFYDAEGMKAISAIPSRDELVSRFRPEKCFSESCLAASRARSQTSLALSIRSQRAKRRNRYYNRKSRIAA